MNTRLSQVRLFFQRIDRRHVQFAFFLLTLALFALGAGAPEEGGIGPR
jgi:hypothetical protein